MRARFTLFFTLFSLMIITILVPRPIRAGWDGESAGLKELLLELINHDRALAGLSKVSLDPIASQVAEAHCRDMLRENFFSHWNSAGQRPYLRYSLAGGNDAVEENLSITQGRILPVNEALATLIRETHTRMMAEEPPEDGHRQTILQPHHTHVGIGFAYDDRSFYLAEEFVAHYLELQPLKRAAAAGKAVDIRGKVLLKDVELAGISVFYEPFPMPLAVEKLNSLRSYRLPEDETILRPRQAGMVYPDGGKGDISYDHSSREFSGRINFPPNRSGFYTIVVWLKRAKLFFPATDISIKVE